MRFPLLIASLLLAAPALAQDQSPPAVPAAEPADKPLHRFPSFGETTNAPRRVLPPPGQLFVSPAGQPFRAPFGEPYPLATWFAQVDTDHDGKIDRPEFIADFEQFFAKLDTDHNNRIEAAEIYRYEHEVLPELSIGGLGAFDNGDGPRGFGGRGRRGGGRPPRLGFAGSGGQDDGGGGSSSRALSVGDFNEPLSGVGRYGIINIPEPITSMDLNLDGTITLEEARRAAIRRFDLLDRDHAIYLRLDDLPIPLASKDKPGRRARVKR